MSTPPTLKRMPWDQLPNEESDNYANFLRYRNLGPCRSLRKAYLQYLQVEDGYTGSKSKLHLPGNWCAAASNHNWNNRAAAWDVCNLLEHGAKTAVLHVLTIKRIAAKTARAARQLSPGQPGWRDVIEATRLVNEYLSPDVVRGIQQRSAPPEPTQPAREPVRTGGAVE